MEKGGGEGVGLCKSLNSPFFGLWKHIGEVLREPTEDFQGDAILAHEEIYQFLRVPTVVTRWRGR